MKDFEFIPHTADIKIKVYGASLEQLFKHALIGMFQAVGPKVKECKKVDDRIVCDKLPEKRSINLNSIDKDALLVDFLSEAVCLSDIHDETYLDVTINELTDTSMTAMLHGIKVQGFDVVEIKAVTYHELNIQCIDGIWQTYIVFDI